MPLASAAELDAAVAGAAAAGGAEFEDDEGEGRYEPFASVVGGSDGMRAILEAAEKEAAEKEAAEKEAAEKEAAAKNEAAKKVDSQKQEKNIIQLT